MDVKRTGMVMLRALIISAVLTGAAIAILALLAWFFHFSDGKINVGVVIINIGACLVGGLVAGKGMKEKKYLWGLRLGALYFAILFAASCAFAAGMGTSITSYITTILICLGSGMLGGMVG